MFDDRHEELDFRSSWPLAMLLLIALVGLTLTSEEGASPLAGPIETHLAEMN